MPKGSTPWCRSRTGTRMAYDEVRESSSSGSTWRAAGRSSRAPARGHGGDQRHRLVGRMARTWRSSISTRRTSRARGGARPCVGTRRRRCTSRTRMGPTSTSWTVWSQVSGRSGPPASVLAPRGPARWDPTRRPASRARFSGAPGRTVSWTARPHRCSRHACQTAAVRCGRPTAHRSPSEPKREGGNPNEGLGHLVVNADGTGEPREIDETTYLSWLGGGTSAAATGEALVP